MSSPTSVAAFQSLLTAFSSAPVLSHFDFNKPRVLQVDCLGFAMSAILSQPDDDGLLHPVSFLSRKLTLAERAQPIYDQELGVILAAFEEWRAWLVGTVTPVAVFSDHANLRYFMTSQRLTPRQARWASYLSSFHFQILHTPGKLNPADPPSRRPDFMDHNSSIPPVTLLRPFDLRDGLTVCSLSTSVSSIDVSFSLPSSDVRDLLLHSYHTDSFLSSLSTASPPSPYFFKGGLWWCRDRLFVPLSLCLKVLTSCHDSPSAGHPGSARMIALITRTFFWPSLRRDVLAFTVSV